MKLRNVRAEELVELAVRKRVTNGRSLRRLRRCGILSVDPKTRAARTTPFGDRVIAAVGKIGPLAARKIRR